MSTGGASEVEVAVVGAGVVGCAVALALSRRGVTVAILEAEPDPGLAASGTNSGIFHTGFDSAPGELETELILRASVLRAPLLEALGVPRRECGALLQPRDESERAAVGRLAENARRNGVKAAIGTDGGLSVPGETVTDPVAFTLALAGAAQRHGTTLLTSFAVSAIERAARGLSLASANGERLGAKLAVNCAGLYADAVARLVGDDSFEIYPRKGEFLVFAPPADQPLEHIALPLPTKRTKGMLVFPTLDGMVAAGPTAVDLEDKRDWSVRPQARAEILATAAALYPPLADVEPVFEYAGLRPAGRGINYLIEPSRACAQLVNVAAIRSTGLSASLGIAERVTELVASLGVRLGQERALEPTPAPVRQPGPWWRRVADYRAQVTA